MNIKAIIRPAVQFAGKNAPTICAVAGSIGVIGTAVLAAKETPKALYLVERAQDERDRDLTTFDKLRIMAPCYIPAVLAGTATICVILAGNRVSVKRLLAISALYSGAQRTLDEYSDKVEEIFGEGSHEKVVDKVREAVLTRNDPDELGIIMSDKGNTLCYDTLSGRYFMSDIEYIRKVQNDFNQQLISNCWMSLNDFYEMLDNELDWITIGDDLGWNVDKMLDIHFSAKVAKNGEPCIVLEYTVMPKYDYIS